MLHKQIPLPVVSPAGVALSAWCIHQTGSSSHPLLAVQSAIDRFVKEANLNVKPFRWTKTPDEIIAALRRGNQMLDLHDSATFIGIRIHPECLEINLYLIQKATVRIGLNSRTVGLS